MSYSFTPTLTSKSKRRNTYYVIRNLLCALCVLLFIGPVALADDVGLVSARLVEGEGNEYAIEVDVTSSMLGAVQAPILPEAFENGDTEYEKAGMLIHLTYPFRGSRALAADDTILLPWARTGVLLRARWADGSKSSGMFLARTEGIPIELATLKPVVLTHGEQLRAAFHAGFHGTADDWRLWIPVLVIALLFPSGAAFKDLWAFIAGLSAALFLSDFPLPSVGLPFALGMVLIASLLAARNPDARHSPAFFCAAVLLGLARLGPGDCEPRMACILGAALFFGGGGSALIWLRTYLPLPARPLVATAALGALAFAGLLSVIFNQPESAPGVTANPLPLQPAAKRAALPAPKKLTQPFMGFLTIEPYEIRVELMASGEAITELLDYTLGDPTTIAIEEQDALKAAALKTLGGAFTLKADGETLEPSSQRGDFLTLGAAGAFTRGEAIDEPLDTAILGLTWVYIRSTPPDTVALNFSQLPTKSLPLTIIDPNGNRGVTLNADSSAAIWQNEGSLETIALSAVDIQPRTWAPLTLLFLVAAPLILRVRGRGPRLHVTAYGCVAASIILFPVARAPLPFAPMDADRAAGVAEHLLTNVYHAFDRREEAAIYDQLAISVTGDQLTEIYLGQRRALELENRGGARARVETVDLTAVDSVQRTQQGVAIDARWKVSGSVNHFGHTHYRRNAYHATLRLVEEEGAWKIAGIEVHEEERVY